MPAIIQNTLYLTTPGTYVARDHLTIQIEAPVYPEDLAPEKRTRENATDVRKLAVPIHHLESICAFGPTINLSAPAMSLCWEHGVSVNFLGEYGRLLARLTGVADTSVTLRRAQFRAADDPAICTRIARGIVAGKIQNARNSLLRGAREATADTDRERLTGACAELARAVQSLPQQSSLDAVRGGEGAAAQAYFATFTSLLKQQRDGFAFTTRNRRPPRDRINCLLSFLYAMVRHDCVSALTERANRPSLALDLMEEFRPWLADRLALTLINRQQIGPAHFREREGGAVELTDDGRRLVITAWQQRKQETLQHPLLDHEMRAGQIAFVQARLLARVLRGDLPEYVPFIPK